jgi:hypothetical protein
LVTVALNQELTGCELKRASQSGGVRFFVEALACFASAYPKDAALELSPTGPVKQSYNRLSDDIQVAIYGPLENCETRPAAVHSFIFDMPAVAFEGSGRHVCVFDLEMTS